MFAFLRRQRETKISATAVSDQLPRLPTPTACVINDSLTVLSRGFSLVLFRPISIHLTVIAREGKKNMADGNKKKSHSRTLFDFSFRKRKLFEQASETESAEVSTSTAQDVVLVCEAEVSTSTAPILEVSVCEADSSSSESEVLSQAQSLPVTSSIKPPPQKKKKKSCFLNEWAKTWPWAYDTATGLRCKLFVKHRKINRLRERFQFPKRQYSHGDSYRKEEQAG